MDLEVRFENAGRVVMLLTKPISAACSARASVHPTPPTIKKRGLIDRWTGMHPFHRAIEQLGVIAHVAKTAKSTVP